MVLLRVLDRVPVPLNADAVPLQVGHYALTTESPASSLFACLDRVAAAIGRDAEPLVAKLAADVRSGRYRVLGNHAAEERAVAGQHRDVAAALDYIVGSGPDVSLQTMFRVGSYAAWAKREFERTDWELRSLRSREVLRNAGGAGSSREDPLYVPDSEE